MRTCVHLIKILTDPSWEKPCGLTHVRLANSVSSVGYTATHFRFEYCQICNIIKMLVNRDCSMGSAPLLLLLLLLLRVVVYIFAFWQLLKLSKHARILQNPKIHCLVQNCQQRNVKHEPEFTPSYLTLFKVHFTLQCHLCDSWKYENHPVIRHNWHTGGVEV